MPDSLEWLQLVEHQHGAVSRQQATAHGFSAKAIGVRLRGQRWHPAFRGVYMVFTGEPSRTAWLWAAVLRAGDGATLSHETAAVLHGLLDLPSETIHVTVPSTRRVRSIVGEAGLRVHLSSGLEGARHPARLPPRTRIEETVLDSASAAASLDSAVGWLTRACSRGLTTTARLRVTLDQRPKQRWRGPLLQILDDVRAGANSLLELRYLRDVERGHGLPTATRQRHVQRGTRSQWEDVHYAAYQTTVELDGRLGHDREGRWRDMRRDNAGAVAGDTVLRYGWRDVTGCPCELAGQVASVLRRRGWNGLPRPCSPGCPIGEHISPV